jgi:hypothetical protein
LPGVNLARGDQRTEYHYGQDQSTCTIWCTCSTAARQAVHASAHELVRGHPRGPFRLAGGLIRRQLQRLVASGLRRPEELVESKTPDGQAPTQLRRDPWVSNSKVEGPLGRSSLSRLAASGAFPLTDLNPRPGRSAARLHGHAQDVFEHEGQGASERCSGLAAQTFSKGTPAVR